MVLTRKEAPYIDKAGAEHPNAVLAAYKTSITHGKELSIFLGIFANKDTVQTHLPLDTIQLRFSKAGTEDYYTGVKYNEAGEITDEGKLAAQGHKPAAVVFTQLDIAFDELTPNAETVLPWLFEEKDNNGIKIGNNWKE